MSVARLRVAATLGLIPAELAERVRDAYREYRRLQHGLRLNNARYARVEPVEVAEMREAVERLWGVVFGEG